MFTMAITATASVLTITLTGEIAGHAADLAPAAERALDGWDGAAIEIDCRAVTAIGIDGAGLLFGVPEHTGELVNLSVVCHEAAARLRAPAGDTSRASG